MVSIACLCAYVLYIHVCACMCLCMCTQQCLPVLLQCGRGCRVGGTWRLRKAPLYTGGFQVPISAHTLGSRVGITAGQQTILARGHAPLLTYCPTGWHRTPFSDRCTAWEWAGRGSSLQLSPSDTPGIFHTTSLSEPWVQFCEDSTQACIPGYRDTWTLSFLTRSSSTQILLLKLFSVSWAHPLAFACVSTR